MMSTNEHEFTYVTSGFHAVTNGYMLSALERCVLHTEDDTAVYVVKNRRHQRLHALRPRT